MLEGLEAAIQRWRTAIGSENVVTDAAQLTAAATTTFKTTRTINAIVRPAGRQEVQECVSIANDLRIPLYAVSTGMNSGYGSKSPTADSCLMELRRMNRILELNEELGYVTVEPGVSQQQLFDTLKDRKSGYWMDSTGASPDCSLIGNTLERGFGHTPYGDHFANTCGFEVVLANGEVIDTGFSRFPGARAGAVHRWGLGPVLDGLFSQSNFGIVTRMTLWLMPAPKHFQSFYFRCDENDGLAALVDALRPLRMDGTLRSAIHIANDYKVISSIQLYPWEYTGGATPLSLEAIRPLRKKFNCGVWNGSGGLYGTKAQVAEARRLIKRALRGKVTRLQFLDDKKLALAGRFAGAYGMVTGWNLRKALDLLKPVYGLMKGIPTPYSLRSCYWRKKFVPEEINIERDGCGLLWCSAVAPSIGAEALKAAGIATSVLLEHGFEPLLSLTLLTERTVGCIVAITYDRAVPGEDDRAMACHDDVLDKLNAAGFYPYRLGVQSMRQMGAIGSYNQLLRDLKTLFDPNRILAPGRYEPMEMARSRAHSSAQ